MVEPHPAQLHESLSDRLVRTGRQRDGCVEGQQACHPHAELLGQLDTQRPARCPAPNASRGRRSTTWPSPASASSGTGRSMSAENPAR
ncbi:MAG: hypothetical protein ACRD0K_19195 [Egibacteraceae bacterium]